MADALIRLPDAIDDETAAAMLLKGMTVEFLVRRTYEVQPGDVVLFHAAAGGAGGSRRHNALTSRMSAALEAARTAGCVAFQSDQRCRRSRRKRTFIGQPVLAIHKLGNYMLKRRGRA